LRHNTSSFLDDSYFTRILQNMSSQLCIVCRSIPGSVWSPEYGLFETCALIKAKLQSFKEMERASAKGCQLCTMFVVGMKTRAGTPKNLNSCLHIRRSFAHPHSGIYITSDEGTGQSMNLFFYVVPRAWSKFSIMNTYLSTTSSDEL
jgi:hypothetical protein